MRVAADRPPLARGSAEPGESEGRRTRESGLDLCWRVELDVSAMTEATQQNSLAPAQRRHAQGADRDRR
jgi:hypothetical protein